MSGVAERYRASLRLGSGQDVVERHAKGIQHPRCEVERLILEDRGVIKAPP